jgi:hypothetical protein
LSERITKLEQSQYKGEGKSAVSDPALADTLSKMAASSATMQSTFAGALEKMGNAQSDALAKLALSVGELSRGSAQTEGKGIGQDKLIAYVLALGGIAIAVAAIVWK